MGKPPQREATKSLMAQIVPVFSRAFQQLKTCVNKQRDGVRAGPSPLKSILAGSTLVDRPAAVPAFPFIAGLAEGTLRACSGRWAFIIGIYTGRILKGRSRPTCHGMFPV
jgi:hypothetical protein